MKIASKIQSMIARPDRTRQANMMHMVDVLPTIRV